MNYNLIVFDLDGTLVDSIPDIAAVYNMILKREGYPVHPTDAYRDFVGWGLKKALELALPVKVSDRDSKRLIDEIFVEYARRPAELTTVYPGIYDLIKYLKTSDIPMIVYTNKACNLAQSVVDAFFPEATFKEVLGYSESFPHKPHPGALNHYLEGKDINLSTILMAGDSPVDLETALNAGIPFAGASWGFRSEKVLQEAGSALNFPGPFELHQWLMKEIKND